MTVFLYNQDSNLTIRDESVFELWKDTTAQKQIILQNSSDLKYGAIVSGSDLTFSVETGQTGSNLTMMLICPIVDQRSLSVDVHLNLRHSDCNITLHLLAFVLSEAKTTLNATIFMEPYIQNSGSSLLEETVVLSPDIRVKSLPILDIHAKNIQAAHGAKIYRLDEEKLFYLESKGLPRTQAQHLLIASYGERLFDGLKLDKQTKGNLISEFLTFEF